jgi:hypothetical protein
MTARLALDMGVPIYGILGLTTTATDKIGDLFLHLDKVFLLLLVRMPASSHRLFSISSTADDKSSSERRTSSNGKSQS